MSELEDGIERALAFQSDMASELRMVVASVFEIQAIRKSEKSETDQLVDIDKIVLATMIDLTQRSQERTKETSE